MDRIKPCQSIVIVFILYSQTSDAGFSIFPNEAFSLTGDTVRLNCTYVSNNPVNWKYRPLGAAASFSFYDQWVGMVKDYRDGGRHTIEQSNGRCDLVITNISMDDVGTYECCDDYGDGDDVELTVLVSNAKCDSNISLTKVLVDNDCNLEPNHMELRCSVGYHGNIPPVLELNHPNRDVMASTTVNRISTPDTATVTRTLRASIELNGTNFTCSVKGVEFGRKRTVCVTDNISVMCEAYLNIADFH